MAVERIAAPLRQQVVAQLKEDITSMVFPPGSRLIERDLCERYDVSRTVVREALRHVEAEGIITTVPNRGPVVTELSLDEARWLFEVRGIMEPAISGFFAERASDAQRRRLIEAVERFRTSTTSGLLADELLAKDEYYDVLLDGCGNPTLSSLFRSLLARIRLLRGLSLSAKGRADQSLLELQAIAAAMEKGDSEPAYSLARVHVNNAAESAIAQMSLGAVATVPH